MPLGAEVESELLVKVGKEATEATKKEMAKVEKELSDLKSEVAKGYLTQKQFDEITAEKLEPINNTLKQLEETSREQGKKMTAALEKAEGGKTKTLEQFLLEQGDAIKHAMENGKYIEYTGTQLKAAGVMTVASTVPTPSPYAPGIGGGPLELFDLKRNPNFITSKIDLGRTDQSRLAWTNELAVEGSPSLVEEGAVKPLTNHTFEIATSVAKKIAAHVEMTDEVEQDLPQMATLARRMLQDDVIRFFDDSIQVDVLAAARAYNITGLNAKIKLANYWDAIGAMMGQIGFYNYTPNTVAINWLTNVMLNAEKATDGVYLIPPSKDEINAMKVYANKLAVDYALVGDLSQYKVDIYKDYTFKVGWINDDFVRNKKAMVGEMRYHSYISEARKNGIAYASLPAVVAQINKPIV